MNFIIGLLMGVSSGTWIYARTMKTTGNNTKSALTVAGIVGGLVFIVFFVLAHKYLHN